MNISIVAGDRIVDGQGSHKETNKLINLATKRGLGIETLTIVNLARRWEDKLGPNEFKSGASAMAAIEKAKKLLKNKKVHVVVIKGEDFLKTGYAPGERERFMKLYNHKYTPLEGYNDLVPLFLNHHKLSEQDYYTVRDALFKNYVKTFGGKTPDEKWFQPLTKYFRGVDCANPSVDYSGQIVLMSDKTADKLKIPKKNRVQILGNAFTKLKVDGMESLPLIAPYLHLKRTINKALREAKVDFKKQFLEQKALMDAYTCYPVVPIGLIHRLGLVKDLKEIPELLQHHEVTVTGGLNLGKAAWNLTSLNALIIMRQKLISSKSRKYGLVHGNGSLGNQQGITILSKSNNR